MDKLDTQVSNLRYSIFMIPCKALTTIYKLQEGYPIVAVTGPRQSGKTTLAKMAFPQKPYVSLETPSQLDFAQNDPIVSGGK